MLPHDELYHYGTKGMRWGIRKQRYLAKSEKLQKKASSERELGEALKKNSKLISFTRQEGNDRINRANYLDRKSARYKYKAEKMQAKIDDVKKKPYNPKNKKRHISTFNKIALGTAGAATGAAAAAIVKPTFDEAGKRVAARVWKKAAKAPTSIFEL